MTRAEQHCKKGKRERKKGKKKRKEHTHPQKKPLVDRPVSTLVDRPADQGLCHEAASPRRRVPGVVEWSEVPPMIRVFLPPRESTTIQASVLLLIH